MLRIRTLGVFPRSEATSGFSLEYGIRASRTSTTRSTFGIAFRISALALAMWPGNQWMGMSPSD